MFALTRQCADFMLPLCQFKVKVIHEGQGHYIGMNHMLSTSYNFNLIDSKHFIRK